MASKNFFSTAVYQTEISSARRLNNQLIKEIFNLSEDDHAGIDWSQKNYANGFTSYASANQMHKTSPTFAELELKIRKHVNQYIKNLKLQISIKDLEMSTCWVNIMGPQCAHSLHIHPHSVISGTYYVQMPKNASAIRFEDPRYSLFMARPPVQNKAPVSQQTHVTLPAKAGSLILFESWLRHEVPMNASQEPRISISFNY